MTHGGEQKMSLNIQKETRPTALTFPRDGDRIETAIMTLADDSVLIVQKGHYIIPESLILKRDIQIIGETGDPKDVIIECTEGGCICFNAPHAIIRGVTFQATDENRCATCIIKDNSTFENCIFIAAGKEFSCQISSEENSNSVFRSCTFQGGMGGVSIEGENSNPSFESCVFKDGDFGVGIIDKGKRLFENCKFIGNKNCGMIILNQGDPHVKDCIFSNNEYGIHVDGRGLGTFENCLITNNTYRGISIGNDGSNPMIRNCKIINNGGYGISIQEGGSGYFVGNEIADNTKGSWDISEKAKTITLQQNFWYDREGKQIFFDNIFEAAAKGSIDDVWFFVKKGLDINSHDDRSPYQGQGITPLHFAAMGNSNIGVLEYLISLGYNVNSKDEEGRTSLHYATEWNPSIRILKYLIAQGAEVNAEDNDGKIPLDLTDNEEKQAILRFAGRETSDAINLTKVNH